MEEIRLRTGSCQVGKSNTTGDKCVTHALDALARVQSLEGDHGAAFRDAMTGATRVMDRLRAEIKRMSTAIEDEQHVRAILDAKIKTIEARHKSIKDAAVRKERAACEEEKSVLERAIPLGESIAASIKTRIRDIRAKDAAQHEQTAEHEAQTLAFEEKIRGEESRTAAANETREQWEAKYIMLSATRLARMQEKDAALREYADVERVSKRRVMEAQTQVQELKDLLVAERQTHVSSQKELNIVQAALAENNEIENVAMANLDGVL